MWRTIILQTCRSSASVEKWAEDLFPWLLKAFSILLEWPAWMLLLFSLSLCSWTRFLMLLVELLRNAHPFLFEQLGTKQWTLVMPLTLVRFSAQHQTQLNLSLTAVGLISWPLYEIVGDERSNVEIENKLCWSVLMLSKSSCCWIEV